MNKRNLSIIVLSGILSVLPAISFAVFDPGQTPGLPEGTTPQTVFNSVADQITRGLWEVFALLAVIMFVLAGVSFMTAQGDPEKVKLARAEFMWGVVGVVVSILAFSMVTIIRNVLKI